MSGGRIVRWGISVRLGFCLYSSGVSAADLGMLPGMRRPGFDSAWPFQSTIVE
jgi:hypothetical protein